MIGERHRYEIEVMFHSYANPTGRCVGCGATTPMGPRCCDVSDLVPVDQSCPTGDTCDTRLGVCLRAVGTTGNDCPNEQFLPALLFDSRLINFDSNFFGCSNPVIVEGFARWQVSSISYIYYYLLTDLKVKDSLCKSYNFPIRDFRFS